MIGNMPPVEYEQNYYAHQPAREVRSRENPASTEAGALHPELHNLPATAGDPRSGPVQETTFLVSFGPPTPPLRAIRDHHAGGAFQPPRPRASPTPSGVDLAGPLTEFGSAWSTSLRGPAGRPVRIDCSHAPSVVAPTTQSPSAEHPDRRVLFTPRTGLGRSVRHVAAPRPRAAGVDQRWFMHARERPPMARPLTLVTCVAGCASDRSSLAARSTLCFGDSSVIDPDDPSMDGRRVFAACTSNHVDALRAAAPAVEEQLWSGQLARVQQTHRATPLPLSTLAQRAGLSLEQVQRAIAWRRTSHGGEAVHRCLTASRARPPTPNGQHRPVLARAGYRISAASATGGAQAIGRGPGRSDLPREALADRRSR